MSNIIISPISIDLGAKNTGVYFAHYEERSSIENIEKEGKVYQLEKDKYTLLMANRTAARHQRRGYDRRQMVKRLFKLIWEKHFQLQWDKDVQQSTSFLLNRRGFTFLTEEYDAEILSRFPEEAFELLPEEFKFVANKNGEYDFASALTEWANEGEEKVKNCFDAINKEPKRIAKREVFIGRTTRLKEYCETRKNDKKIEEPAKTRIKLSRLSRWIWDEWQECNVDGLDENFVARDENNNSQVEWKSSDSFDLVTYLNNQTRDVACQILDSLPDTSNEKEILRKSIWNFKAVNFKLEGEDFTQPESPPENSNTKEKAVLDWKKLHLQHLAFALHLVLNELQSGGRHRRKYFKEVKTVLENPLHTHCYLKSFCSKLQAGDFESLDNEKLSRLIGHLSNLELKPLRKYFNNRAHRKSDYWNEADLSKIFNRWILREWRVNPEKDKDKARDKPGYYKKLQKDWGEYIKTKPNTVVNFWVETDPFLTIPPYQDNNNRRPPKCQSLILNPTFLDNKYPEWQHWLEELGKLETVEKYLDDFKDQLENLKSGKKNSYFPDKKTEMPLDARVLQFIFDRAKDSDPLKLNEIYSHSKKWRQKQSTDQERQDAKSKLEKAIGCSHLPDGLKTDRDYDDIGKELFKKETFLHLVCKYYKQRQRAKEGRLFIHPEYRYVKNRGFENTGRFDDKNCLLTYCNHKPRQKKYQSLHDLAEALQIAPEKLKEVCGTDVEKIIARMEKETSNTSSLKANCDRAAKEQKGLRGRLKIDIQSVYSIVHNNQDKSPREALGNSRVKDAFSLYNFCERAKRLCCELTKELYPTEKQKSWRTDLERNPAAAVYLLAKLNNIAYKDRSGNSNTCPVCSADNAYRMQSIEITKDNGSSEYSAKAQRLPAIPTRLIDGAVMRMARIVGGAIAKDKWKKIREDLIAGKNVCVPIITESNRFEFEPSLKDIKGKPLKNADKKNRESGQEQLTTSKDERIKEASLGRCPYTGNPLGVGGDKDHIIPRSSGFGTLNDEANLIWASDDGNRKIKQDQEFSLTNLNPEYKQKQFETSNDQEITKQIVKEIWDSENEKFTFGRYRSFINLTRDQQKAFRHALFLVGYDLRQQVINAIDNRNRALVNGTQHYFAEEIANNLYKLYKKDPEIKKQGLLSFDYFGVEAQSSPRGDGIYDLRKRHEEAGLLYEEYSKKKGDKQKPYSHLIDAQLAFAIVADAHKNEGSLKLDIPDSISLWPADTDTGEIFQKTIFGAIHITPEQLCERKLERRKPNQTFFSHRSIHRDGIYAERYTPILVHKETGKVRIGFDWKNSYELKDDETNREKLYFALQFNLQGTRLGLTQNNSLEELKNCLISNGFRSKAEYFPVPLNVRSIHDYYIKNYSTSKGYREYDDKMKFLRSLSWRTEKKKITTLEEAQKILSNENNFQISLNLTLPVREEWKRLIDKWEKTGLEDHDFLKNFFKVPETKPPHEKVRKVFSLPVKSGEGKFLIKRNSWNGEDIFQIVNDSDSRKLDTKAFIPVFIKNEERIGKLLSESACSERLFLLGENTDEYQNQISNKIAEIDPYCWFPITVPDELCKVVQNIEYRIDNITRPRIRITLNGKLKPEQIDTILGNRLLKPKDTQTLKTQLQEAGDQGVPIEYTGTGFNRSIGKVLFPVLEKHYQ